MRYATLRIDGHTRGARLVGGNWELFEASDVGEILRGGAREPTGSTVAVDEAEFAPVVMSPRKIVCVGLNYARHVRETGRELPTYPSIFSKYSDALIGPNDPVVLPAEATEVDWEAELALVIGRAGRRIDPTVALEHVAGYTVLNDVSMRDWQRHTTQWLAGKSFDRTTPVGPVLVTPDELPTACAGLGITCSIDGVEMQADVIGDFIFDIPTVIAYVSTFTELSPGDIIATGTPDGVGMGRLPQVFLMPGQRMVTTIDGIGSLVNDIRHERAEHIKTSAEETSHSAGLLHRGELQ